jgi:hypothetical protein
MNTPIPKPGQKIHHWTVIAIDGRRATVQCRCRQIRIVAIESLQSGAIKSCGCSQSPEEKRRAIREAANGLTWGDVIAPPLLPATENDASEWRTMRDFCWQRSHLLRPREAEFVNDLIRWRGRLTEKQEVWLTAIYTRVAKAAPQG